MYTRFRRAGRSCISPCRSTIRGSLLRSLEVGYRLIYKEIRYPAHYDGAACRIDVSGLEEAASLHFNRKCIAIMICKKLGNAPAIIG